MDKYINGNLVMRLLIYKTRKHPDWEHYEADCRFLFWKIHKDYWYFIDPCFGIYTEEGMISSLDSKRTFYKEGVVYQKPHIILEFSEKCADTIYFDSDEEMEGWFESFMEEFGKPFIYID